jgi:tripartite-type tricarboxylate transporter receptor subunit TctC
MRKFVVLLLGSLALPFAAHAQNYPARPITVVVPFPAGGPSDIVARILAEHMSRERAASWAPRASQRRGQMATRSWPEAWGPMSRRRC